jgi:hypothetical protein
MSNTGDKYVVNLLDKVCDCRKWLLTGLPCCHAISCMKYKYNKIANYVPSIFKKEQYVACYSSIIFPINGQDLWMRTDCTGLQQPPVKRQPRRPRCKQTGHNKSTCPLPPPPAPPPTDQTQSSQPPTESSCTKM